jgi:hypothetical protein
MKLLSLGLGALVAVSLAGACGGGAGTGGTGGSGGSSTTHTTGSSTTGSGAGGGVIGDGCTPACVAPQHCGESKVCLDPGTCAVDGDCSGGLVCDAPTHACVPGGGCASQAVMVKPVPPNLLVVLDRSCSMTEVVTGTQTKWMIAVGALSKLTTDYNARIRFGLTLFPDTVTPNCGQGAIPIPVGDANESAIQALLTASLAKADPYFPDGPCVTNIDTAVLQGAAEPALAATDRGSYLLLVTDGKQSGCSLGGGDAGTLAAITDLQTNKLVSTFVVGFGSGVDVAQMNAFADAGGVPSGDPTTHFYKAEDQASLDTALAVIAAKTLSCTYALATVPPDPAKIYVFFDKDPAGVPRDPSHVGGWDYDATHNQVTFYGASCAELKSGQVTDLDIVLDCNQLPPG